MSVLFQKISEKYTSIRTINVFSNGAASQFKQQYLFSNLHGWEKKFSTSLTWNFFATLYGKGAVDVIGGTVKQSVWRATHAGSTVPYDAAYAEFAAKRNPNINVIYVPSAEIEENSAEIVTIWKSAIAVPNTQKLHCMRAHNSKQLHVSSVSGDDILLIGIFKGVVSNEEEEDSVQDSPILTRNVNLGDSIRSIMMGKNSLVKLPI